MQHRANLDILRAIAVTAVLVDHILLSLATYGHVPLSIAAQYRIESLGHVAVLAFFVHTSLVLMDSLERLRKTGGHMTLRFYVRRVFRIYPLAIVAVAAAAWFHVLPMTWNLALIQPVTHRMIVANLLLVQNIVTGGQVLAPMWSLPFEVQMYLVLPLLFLLVSRKRGPSYIAALFLGASALCLAMLVIVHHSRLLEYVPCFLSGVLSYGLRRNAQPKYSGLAWPFFVAIAFAAYTCCFPMQFPPVWAGWIFCLVLGLAVNRFHDAPWKPGNLLAKKVALYSYGIYLLHPFALFLVFPVWRITNTLAGSAASIALTLLFAVVAFHLIESPGIEFGRRITGSDSRRPLEEDAAVTAAP